MKPEGQNPPNIFLKKNDTVRIDFIESADEKLTVPLLAFLRRIGTPHLYAEWIQPTLTQQDSILFYALRDRPWPPWGVGAQKIDALCLANPIAPDSVGISPVFVNDEDHTNVGLISAVYKEALETVINRSKQAVDVSYLIIEGSVLADRVFRSIGFKKTDDLFLTEDSRYHFYRANANDLLTHLGLAKASTFDLLAHDIDDDVLVRNASFHATIALGSRGGLLERFARAEIIPIDGGPFDAALPGGVS